MDKAVMGLLRIDLAHHRIQSRESRWPFMRAWHAAKARILEARLDVMAGGRSSEQRFKP